MENGEEIKNKPSKQKNLPIGKGKVMGEASLLLAPSPIIGRGIKIGQCLETEMKQ